MRTYVLEPGHHIRSTRLAGPFLTPSMNISRPAAAASTDSITRPSGRGSKNGSRTIPTHYCAKPIGIENIEQIFTVLDLAEGLISDSYISILRAAKKGADEAKEAEAHHDSFASEIREYRDVRSKLLWAMEDFFLQRNYDDFKDYSSDNWKNLKRFGRSFEPGDIVITFNYDSTIERVLLTLGKWSLSDGYGTEIVFQRNDFDTTPGRVSPSFESKGFAFARSCGVVHQACLFSQLRP